MSVRINTLQHKLSVVDETGIVTKKAISRSLSDVIEKTDHIYRQQLEAFCTRGSFKLDQTERDKNLSICYGTTDKSGKAGDETLQQKAEKIYQEEARFLYEHLDSKHYESLWDRITTFILSILPGFGTYFANRVGKVIDKAMKLEATEKRQHERKIKKLEEQGKVFSAAQLKGAYSRKSK